MLRCAINSACEATQSQIRTDQRRIIIKFVEEIDWDPEEEKRKQKYRKMKQNEDERKVDETIDFLMTADEKSVVSILTKTGDVFTILNTEVKNKSARFACDFCFALPGAATNLYSFRQDWPNLSEEIQEDIKKNYRPHFLFLYEPIKARINLSDSWTSSQMDEYRKTAPPKSDGYFLIMVNNIEKFVHVLTRKFGRKRPENKSSEADV